MTDIAFYNALAHFFLGYAHAHEVATCETATSATNTGILRDDAKTDEANNKRRDLLLA